MQERNSRGVALARGVGFAVLLVLIGVAVLLVPSGSDTSARSTSTSTGVERASERFDRARDAVAVHETDTGVADPTAAVVEARSRLDVLQDRRDRAVASGDPAASVLERQVATAQQVAFDLDAVAKRRAALVDARRDAAAALEQASRGETSGAAGSASESQSVGRMVLAGLLFAGGLGVAVLVFVRSRRPRRRVVRVSPRHPVEPQPQPQVEASRLSLDEMERRLAELEPHDA